MSWRRNPFGRLFDLIASEYGWNDDTIGRLRLDRAAHVRDMISARRLERRRTELDDLTQQTRALASYIAAAGRWQKGVDAAAQIDFVPPALAGPKPPRPLPSTKDVLAAFGAAGGMTGR